MNDSISQRWQVEEMIEAYINRTKVGVDEVKMWMHVSVLCVLMALGLSWVVACTIRIWKWALI